jgi:outer membrane lipoprotein-sorting protein
VTRVPSARLTLLVVLVCAFLLTPPTAGAAEDEGRALFAASARWIRASSSELKRVERVFVDLQDVTITGSSSGSHEGNSRIHLDLPDRMRWEIRTLKRTPVHKRVVKILDGARGWAYVPPGTDAAAGYWDRLHGNPNNPGAIAQLQKDRDVFASLTRYLTLRGLDGAGVTFSDEGVATFLKGHHLAGRWRKVRRVAASGERMAFLFATAEVAGKQVVQQPHAVLVPGDKQAGRATEHLVLTKWRLVAGRQVPGRVVRYTQDDKGRFATTLDARIVNLVLNPPLSAGLFKPTPPKVPPPPPQRGAGR